MSIFATNSKLYQGWSIFLNYRCFFNSEERSFNGRQATFGYSYKFYIMVDGHELVFEKDDEQEYRVLSEAIQTTSNKDLLQAIIQSHCLPIRWTQLIIKPSNRM